MTTVDQTQNLREFGNLDNRQRKLAKDCARHLERYGIYLIRPWKSEEVLRYLSDDITMEVSGQMVNWLNYLVGDKLFGRGTNPVTFKPIRDMITNFYDTSTGFLKPEYQRMEDIYYRENIFSLRGFY